MQVFIDTNIVADVFLHRTGWEVSQAAIEWCLPPGRCAWLSWPAVATLAYLLESRGYGPRDIEAKMEVVLGWCSIVGAPEETLRTAIDFHFADFEDAMQAAFAVACGADVIITRNVTDFTGSPVPAMTPKDFLARQTPGA